jgi:hypothetical protein
MTTNTTSLAPQQQANAVLAFLDSYQAFVKAVERKMTEEGLNPTTLAKKTGVATNYVNLFIRCKKVYSKGVVFKGLAKYAGDTSLTNRLNGQIAFLGNDRRLIGLAILPKDSVQLALDLYVAFNRDHGHLILEQFAMLLPHSEIARKSMRFHRDSVASLVGNVAQDIETFLLSSEYSKALKNAQMLPMQKQKDATRKHRMPESISMDRLSDSSVDRISSEDLLVVDHQALVEEFKSRYGSILKAMKALKLHSRRFSTNYFKSLRRKHQINALNVLRSALCGEVATVRESVEKTTKILTDEVHVSLPTYDPGQAGIDFAGTIIRLTYDTLMSFSQIKDVETRRAVRSAIDPDIAMLLHAVHVHASDCPGQVAKLLGGDELLRKMGLTGHSTQIRGRK